ncbi:pyruvate formate-lyase PFL [Pelosinus fermentans B4]|nr:pyruvate formate-lyase PFL [Pelosinus fermentans B4]
MEQRGMNERIRKLRNQSLTVEPHLSIERARLVTEAYEKHLGTVETPILRALTFQHIMENKTLCINEGELIVGEKGEQPQYAPSFPELCCHTEEDLEVMDQRDKIFFKVDDAAKKLQKEKIIPFWEKRSMRKNILDQMSAEWLACYESGIFTEFMEQRGPGHTVADGKMYTKGFLDSKAEIQEQIKALDFLEDPLAYEKKSQLEAMALCCDAIVTYGERYAQYAKAMAHNETDENKKAELLEIAVNCQVVPAHKPETFA